MIATCLHCGATYFDREGAAAIDAATVDLREEARRLHDELARARTVERADLIERLNRLHRVVEAARAVHDRCEHASNSGDEYAPTCPACDCWQSEPHKPGCSMDALRAALAALEGEGRE